MGRLVRYLIAVAILAGSGWLAAYLVSLPPEPERRELPPQIPFVQTGRVEAGSGGIPVHGVGTVRPSAAVDIAALVSGRVTWLDPGFQTGGRIDAGQTILRIEEADYLHRLREAEADLESRQAALFEAREQADFARSEFEQFSRLQREAGAAPGELGPLALREPQIKAAQAEVSRAEVRIDEAKLALARTEVAAPIDGHVIAESVDVGQFVTAGQAVGRLIAADAVEVVVPLSDADATLIPGLWSLRAGDSGRRVTARVIAEYGDGNYAWKGYVDRAEASLDERSRTVDVIVRVPNPFSGSVPASGNPSLGGPPPLLVGKFVEVQITGVAPEGYFRVPRAALQTGNVVWVVRSGQTVSIIPVRVLQRFDDQAFVTGELEDGDLVVTGGLQFVTEGMAVQTGAGSAQ